MITSPSSENRGFPPLGGSVTPVRPTRRAAMLSIAGALSAVTALRSAAAPMRRPAPLVISNAMIFDGIEAQLKPGSVIIRDRVIERISPTLDGSPAGGTVIDARGLVLMPGLTDAHWHMMAASSLEDLQLADAGLIYANTVVEAERTLLRGVTTVRDMGGAIFGIKAAIDAGTIPGPRVYPSGALISSTGGHGDFTPAYASPKTLGGRPSRLEELGMFMVVNGVPEMLAAARQQLRMGASQIKLAVGGGVISEFDPIDSLQFTSEEIRAAVEVAEDAGTYVAAHVYTAAGIRRSLEAGVLSIEHGHLADEQTIRLIGAKGAWLSTQAFEAEDDPAPPESGDKASAVVGTWERILHWAKQYGVKVAFGTDARFQPGTGNTMLTRFAKVYGNVETLRLATSGNCTLFARSGARNPYREAELGVIKQGAWADLLLVDGDPTRNIDVLEDYERNLMLIVKDGRVYKNTLPRGSE